MVKIAAGSNRALYLRRGNSMADQKSILFSPVSAHRKEPKACESCGSILPSHKHKYCDSKCKYDRMRAERTHTHCSYCGGLIGSDRSVHARYCSNLCKSRARNEKEKASGKTYKRNAESERAYNLARKIDHEIKCNSGATKVCSVCKKEKPVSEYYHGHKSCKPCVIEKVKERNRKLKTDDPAMHLMLRARKKAKEGRPYRYSQHVLDWKMLGLDYRKSKVKHDEHVKTFGEWKKTLQSRGWFARKLKSEGRPWANPHISSAARYKIRYRLDVGFRLGEINRNTWRKKTLKAREDGTVNFWKLMRERKTCPYCLTLITKENAVADHMQPIKLGGANSQHNLTICCKECNKRKAGRPYAEWVEMLPIDRKNAALAWYKRKHGHGPEQQSLCFEFNV
jgi:5-methylcytosine-specific restriction endonuclease McrA